MSSITCRSPLVSCALSCGSVPAMELELVKMILWPCKIYVSLLWWNSLVVSSFNGEKAPTEASLIPSIPPRASTCLLRKLGWRGFLKLALPALFIVNHVHDLPRADVASLTSASTSVCRRGVCRLGGHGAPDELEPAERQHGLRRRLLRHRAHHLPSHPQPQKLPGSHR